MRRLLATLYGDARLQLRQGFYYAATFVLLWWLLLLGYLERDGMSWVLPVVVLGNVQLNAFYFIGGLLLLEKRQGTLEAQAVTPLRFREYLASKVLSLAALSLVENLVLAWLLVGGGLVALPYVAGLLLGSCIFSLAGFLVVVRYDSINEFLMPSFLVVLLLCLPLAPYFGLWESRLLELHPIQPALRLIRVGVGQDVPRAWAGALGSAVLWIGAAAFLCRRTFFRFVVAGEAKR